MKKKLAVIALIIATMAFTACGANNTKEDNSTTTVVQTDDTSAPAEEDANSEVVMSAQDIADSILANAQFKDKLSAVDKTMALTRLYELEEEQIEDAAFYTNSQATAEEIAVIKVASDDYLSKVTEAYEARIEDQKSACESYLPDEMPKLDSAIIYTQGKYAVLCISDDNSTAKDVVAASIK